ncbi:MAG: recombinase family protein [Acidimicrobiaceae bacterium]|nr:recombinase family protein [Acidimicrobiaceae bacterium]
MPTTQNPDRTPARTLAYLRCSTDEQAESGLGLDAQRRAVEMWAAATGHDSIEYASENGLSGSVVP